MNNLELYERVRAVPQEAQKPFNNGRFKGTDINPMWRIKMLTSEFGPCGIGWYYTIVDKWLETGTGTDEVVAQVQIHLFVKVDGEWSKPIEGIGGSSFIATQRNGLYVNDEMYKMALTDAISVACKALGFGADIYWDKDNTKYNDAKRTESNVVSKKAPKSDGPTWRDRVMALAKERGISPIELAKDYHLNHDTTEDRFREVYEDIKG